MVPASEDSSTQRKIAIAPSAQMFLPNNFSAWRGFFVSSTDYKVTPEPESPIVEVSSILVPAKSLLQEETRVPVVNISLSQHGSTIKDVSPLKSYNPLLWLHC